VLGQGALSAWSTATGFDAHSALTDPMFTSIVAPYNLAPGPGSPLVGAGDPNNYAPTTITGQRRTLPPNVGAY
jgi:hypothetical protein